jgi:hypothetical protein
VGRPAGRPYFCAIALHDSPFGDGLSRFFLDG